jgi:hypothetical protein
MARLTSLSTNSALFVDRQDVQALFKRVRQVIVSNKYSNNLRHNYADPSSRAVKCVGLRPFTCCDHGFESHRGHGWFSVVNVVCCQVEVSATDWSLAQRSPTDCGALLCLIKKPRTRGGYSPARGLQNTNPQWVVAPVKKA